jgi:hypothetical protein
MMSLIAVLLAQILAACCVPAIIAAARVDLFCACVAAWDVGGCIVGVTYWVNSVLMQGNR